MYKTNVFSIPLSKVLKNMKYWITTTSDFKVTFRPSQNILVFSGSIVFDIKLDDDSIHLDLLRSKPFSFALVSKGKVYVGRSLGILDLFPNFDKLILIEDTKLSRILIKRISFISDTIKPQDLISSLTKILGPRNITVLSKRDFYYFQEVSFLRSDVKNVELYISRILDKMIDFSEEDFWRTKTVLYEVFDNSLEHGSKFSGNKVIKVETLISNNGLHVIVSDQGEGFNLSQVNISFSHDKPTGRGIMMIKTLSDMFMIKDKGRTTGVFINREKSQYIPFIA
ncbi:MAG: ATP-binding protein [Spirochaetia bacterium]|nr:ATP-binding protein [Spirochaetota bacterium]MDW8112260.1 ATP-binding protein [Spirochaetia bacterium]